MNEAMSTTGLTLGLAIKEAREAKHYSQQDVANHLKLRLSVVRAIEDDKDNIGVSPAFLKGYIRNYARMIGLSDDSLDQYLDDRLNEDKYGRLTGHAARGHESVTSHFPLELVSGFLAIALFIGILSWWQTGYQEDIAVEQAEVAELETINEEEQAESLRLAEEQKLLEAKAEEEAAMLELAEAARNAEISFAFSKNSWVEVTDSAGNRVVAGVRQPGQDLVLPKGEMPLTVILGVSDAVSLKINEEAIDFKSFVRPGGVAKFKLSLEDNKVVLIN